MSVLAINRNESRYEPIKFSIKLHDMLNELAQRNFGIKDLNHFVRMRYAYGKDDTEDFARYRYLLLNCKTNLDMTATLLTNNLIAANSIYATSVSEFEKRREYMNIAIGNCSQLLAGLQRAIDIFEVDINSYEIYQQAIDREIDLIKKWRQRDNKLKSKLMANF